MRFVAAIAISLVSAVAVFVAGFALLHGIRSPERETGTASAGIEVPKALESSIEVIDRHEHSVRFEAAEASARAEHVLRGTCPIPGASRLILRSLAGHARVLTETRAEADGSFRFEAMPPGRYELRVLDARGKPLHREPRIELYADRAVEVLRPEQLRVRVHALQNGQPLAKAFVILTRDNERLATGTTNDEGKLELEAIAPGPLRWRIWQLELSGEPSENKTLEWRGNAVLAPTDTELRIEIPRS